MLVRILQKKECICEQGSMLIEAIVAISIFMVGFGSVLVLNAQALHIVPQISRQLIASELAQEGVEIIRNQITTNAIRGDVFNTNLSDGYHPVFSALSGGPTIDSVTCDPSSDLTSDVCVTQLYLPSLSLLGNYSVRHPLGTEQKTSFQRIVSITTGNHELKVNSIVTWDGSSPSLVSCPKTQNNCINVEDHLFDWQ